MVLPKIVITEFDVLIYLIMFFAMFITLFFIAIIISILILFYKIGESDRNLAKSMEEKYGKNNIKDRAN